ncbi:MAG: S9 family peptidase [Gammaproteobacteria bacterium]|nr:MAG: S9 family peptidase [Gammaproteobacteria bacterium]
MKKLYLQTLTGIALLFLTQTIASQPIKQTNSAEQLTIDRIYSSPSLDGQTPRSLKLSPDGKRVTYRQGKKSNLSRYDLWEYNIASQKNKLLVDADDLIKGVENLSDEEKARRERQRIYGSGIMEYFFSNDGTALLFPLNGDIYYYNLVSQKAKRLTQTKAFETDIKFSPKGHYVSFIRQQNLFILNINTGKEKQLTKDGKGVIKNGMAEFVAQEEMKRMTGYWWSPNEKHIAFLKVDESPVKTIIRNEIYAEKVKLIKQRYPATGTNNVKIKLAVTDIQGKKTRFVKLGKEIDIYIPRVKWFPNSKQLSFQWQSRDQKTLKLNAYNLKNNKVKTLLIEYSDHWINLNNDLTFLPKNNSFIWASERDGYKHFYHYSSTGKLLAQLTKGKWVVNDLITVDEKNNWLYFTARADTPLERHLYKIPLDGKSPEHVVRVSKRNGFHSIIFAKRVSYGEQNYIDKFSNITTPPQVSLHKSTGEQITWLAENKITAQHPAAPYIDALIQPTFGVLKSADNKADLYYKIYQPKDLIPGKKYPVIVNVYGGPHAQRVANIWQGLNMIQYYLQHGYIVFQLDNRGSNYRGTAFEFPIYRQLGDIEIKDQITGVKYLQSLPFVDKKRIGIYGHSYGGYMALMAMFTAGDYFCAGVAGAPVTDWMLYDTHYTERYLDHPKNNSNGYQQSSVFPYIDGLKGDLLIYHGMADDNVLFTNTTKLIKALQDKNKHFDLMTYPGSKHSMRGKKVKVHLNNTIADFFEHHLKH